MDDRADYFRARGGYKGERAECGDENAGCFQRVLSEGRTNGGAQNWSEAA